MCKLRPYHLRTYPTSCIMSCSTMKCPVIISHDELFQCILSPMLNPISCDRRGTLGMLRSNTFTLLLTASNPQPAETPARVAMTPVLSTLQLYFAKKHSLNFYTNKPVSCGRRGRFEVNLPFRRRNNPPMRKFLGLQGLGLGV